MATLENTRLKSMQLGFGVIVAKRGTIIFWLPCFYTDCVRFEIENWVNSWF